MGRDRLAAGAARGEPAGARTYFIGVEPGQAFFGIPLAQVLPYVVSRTIHTQTGIFWIATAWLATGLYIAPLLSGKEPKLQKLGVDVLHTIRGMGYTVTEPDNAA